MSYRGDRYSYGSHETGGTPVQPLQTRRRPNGAPSQQQSQAMPQPSSRVNVSSNRLAQALKSNGNQSGSSTPSAGPSYRNSLSSNNTQQPARYSSSHARRTSALSFASVSDMDEDRRPYGGEEGQDEMDGVPEGDYSLEPEEPQPAAPKAMANVLAAFSEAGKRRNNEKQQQPAVARRDHSGISRLERLQQDFPSTPAFRAIQRALSLVAQDWPMLLPQDTVEDGYEHKEEAYNPTPLALSLLDPANPEEADYRLQEFLQLKEDLAHALKAHIQLHYRQFDASVSAYNGVVGNLKAAQKQVHTLKGGIGDVSKVLGSKREELAGMVSRRDELREMDRILDTIDHLKDVPDRLETLLSEKRFLAAVVLLAKSIKTINKAELLDINALADLRIYLQSQESAVYEILMEELHNHLYLKSFYCDGRWKSYVKGQSHLPVIEAVEEDITVSAASRQTSRIDQYLHTLATKPPVDPMMANLPELANDLGGSGGEDDVRPPSPTFGPPPSPTLSTSAAARDALPTSRTERINPELDSFAYIDTLFESLAVLGKLPDAVESVAHRIPVEIFNLVEATVDEVDKRNNSNSETDRKGSTIVGPVTTLAGRLSSAQSSAMEMSAETLRDLFWTLYSKFDAILQGFRVGYEVCMRIGERGSFNAASRTSDNPSANTVLSLVEIWKPVQAEVRLMLHEYLTEDEEGGGTSRSQIASINDVLKGSNSTRGASKSLFKFSDSEADSTRDFKSHEDELNKSLKASVPGLVHAVGEGTAALSAVASTEPGDPSAAQHRGIHRILTTPDPYNVSVLFQPTLSFVDRMKDVLPPNLSGNDERGIGAFLDDFVANTYLPMLEDKVSSVYLQAVSGADAFEEDTTYRRHEEPPLVKSVVHVVSLVDSLCAMLWSTPFHHESYCRLIISVVEQFFLKWQERYNDLTASDVHHTTTATSPSKPTKRASTWAQEEPLFQVMQTLLGTKPGSMPSDSDMDQEVAINFDLVSRDPLTEDDVITSPKKLAALGNMNESLRWLRARLSALHPTDDQAPTPGSSAQANRTADGSNRDGRLPLTANMASAYTGLLQQLQRLADSSLAALRCELRIKVLYNLSFMSRENILVLHENPSGTDRFVAELNSQLAESDESLGATLASHERNCVLTGLPLLIDRALVANAQSVAAATSFGGNKMFRNVLSLQQNLKNLGDFPLYCNLERSKCFWGLLQSGSVETLLDPRLYPNDPFSYEELQCMLRLICGVSDAGEAVTDYGDPDRYQDSLHQLELQQMQQ